LNDQAERKEMNSKTMRVIGVAVGLMGMLLARPAAAQWSASTYGVAEFDTDQTLLLLAGLSAGPHGVGIQPRIGVQAYHLGYDAGSPGRTSVFTVKPFVGISNALDDGAVTASVGYAFANKDVANPTAAAADQGDGVVLSGGWESYGSKTPLALQLLGSYNFGTSSLWTRGRATGKISERSSGSTRLGGEVAFLNGDNYTIVQPGAVLEFHSGSRVLGLGAGMKFFKGGDSNVYFKVEGSTPLGK
jgi:hypothetical protein